MMMNYKPIVKLTRENYFEAGFSNTKLVLHQLRFDGVLAQRYYSALINSTSKINVALGGMALPAPRAP